MLKIGDVAKQFNISNRTLRYWEEVGILESSRMENGYRFYDQENEARIRQIVLLRRLKMPIADIEGIFLKADFDTARNALTEHLENLKREAAVYSSMIVLIEKLIQYIAETRSLEQVFSCLETQSEIIKPEFEKTSKIQISERGIPMSTEQLSNVRIVRLPAMTVASYRAEGKAPELDCHDVMGKFVSKYNLHKKSGFRHFGFNNPSPSENNTIYGYEIWVTVHDDLDIPKPLVKKQIDGTLYASISTQLNEIGERWQVLAKWVENSNKYTMDPGFQWLEECVNFETFISSMGNESIQQLDLLEPIKIK